jgi:hypothetical protein
MTMFMVHHTRDWGINGSLNLMTERELATYRPNKLKYNVVALVELPSGEDYGDTFRITNHIDRPWYDNPEVKWCDRTARSTSVGDLVENVESKELYVCASIGWCKVTWEDFKTSMNRKIRERKEVQAGCR